MNQSGRREHIFIWIHIKGNADIKKGSLSVQDLRSIFIGKTMIFFILVKSTMDVSGYECKRCMHGVGGLLLVYFFGDPVWIFSYSTIKSETGFHRDIEACKILIK